MYSTSDTVDGPAVYRIAGGWTESKLMWAMRPPRTSEVLADAGASAVGGVDRLRPHGRDRGQRNNLVMATDSSDGIKFSSREGGNPPGLVITTSTN